MTGADGRPVPPTLPLDFRHFVSGRPRTLEPREPLVLSYGPETWVSLRSFGHAPLAPGRYTRTAIPLVEGPDVQADVKTVRSDQQPITVSPEPTRRRRTRPDEPRLSARSSP